MLLTNFPAEMAEACDVSTDTKSSNTIVRTGRSVGIVVRTITAESLASTLVAASTMASQTAGQPIVPAPQLCFTLAFAGYWVWNIR